MPLIRALARSSIEEEILNSSWFSHWHSCKQMQETERIYFPERKIWKITRPEFKNLLKSITVWISMPWLQNISIGTYLIVLKLYCVWEAMHLGQNAPGRHFFRNCFNSMYFKSYISLSPCFELTSFYKLFCFPIYSFLFWVRGPCPTTISTNHASKGWNRGWGLICLVLLDRSYIITSN